MSKEKDVTETVISNHLAFTKRRVKLFLEIQKDER